MSVGEIHSKFTLWTFNKILRNLILSFVKMFPGRVHSHWRIIVQLGALLSNDWYMNLLTSSMSSSIIVLWKWGLPRGNRTLWDNLWSLFFSFFLWSFPHSLVSRQRRSRKICYTTSFYSSPLPLQIQIRQSAILGLKHL